MIGGAIWVNGTQASTITQSAFSQCSAYNAAAVFYDGTEALELTSCRFEDCSSNVDPVCLLLRATSLTYQNLTFAVTLDKALVKIEQLEQRQIIDCHVDGKGGSVSGDQHWIVFDDSSQPDVTIENCSFTSFSREGQGGGVFRFGGESSYEVVIVNSTFSNIAASGDGVNGGAVSFPWPWKIHATVTDCTFEECSTGNQGGALYFHEGEGGTVSVSGCTFITNSAAQGGQSLHVYFERWLVEEERDLFRNCTFKSHTKKYPVAIQPTSTELGAHMKWLITESSFEANIVTEDDGMVSIYTQGGMTYEDCTFVNNQSPTGLLAFCKSDTVREFNLTRCVFEGCQTRTKGLFFSTRSVVHLYLDQCRFVSCTSTESGVVIDQADGLRSLRASDCEFIECTGKQPAFFFTNDISAVYFNCRFDQCQITTTGSHVGGNMYFGQGFSGTSEIQGCTFTTCTSDHGAVCYSEPGGSHSVENCTFTGNTARVSGHAIRIAIPQNGALNSYTIRNCTFSGHQGSPLVATNWDSNIRVEQWTLEECLFIKNTLQQTEQATGLVGAWASTLTYDHCQFKENTGSDGSSGLLVISIDQCQSCRFDTCTFESNTPTHSMIVSLQETTVDTLTFDGCSFIGERATILKAATITHFSVSGCLLDSCTGTSSEPGIFVVGPNRRIACQDVSIMNTDFIQCESGNDNTMVLDVICDTMTFEMSNINLSVTQSKAIALELNTKTNTLAVESCNFSNSQQEVSDRYIYIASGHTDVQFRNCDFVDIGSQTGGAGLKIALTGETAILTVNGCHFTRCFCQYDGGAIHGQQTTEIRLSQCTFDSCYSTTGFGTAGGSGGVVIEPTTKRGSITECTFISNKSPLNAQSLLIQCNAENPCDRIELQKCTFRSHDRGSIVAFVGRQDDDVYVFDGSFTLSSCIFEQNNIGSEGELDTYGVFNGKCTNGVSYEDCQFYSVYCGGYGGDYCIISLGLAGGTESNSPHCQLRDCYFEQCSRSDIQYGMLQHYKNYRLVQFTITNCQFKQCYGAIFKFSSDNLERVSITDCRFEECNGNEGAATVISMGTGDDGTPARVGRMEVTSCIFLRTGYEGSWWQESGTALLDVHAGESVIESCTFSCSMSDPCSAITVYLRGSDQALFDNCTITNTLPERQTQGIEHFIHSQQSGEIATAQLVIDNCSFTELVGHGTACGVAVYSECRAVLKVTDSKFLDVSTYDSGYGAAVFTTSDTKNVELYNSSFERCSGKVSNDYFGGGAVYISSGFESTIVQGCQFIANQCASHGQSLQLGSPSGQSPVITIHDCTFMSHTGNLPLISFKIKYSGGNWESEYTTPITISACVFEENTISSESGVLYIKATSMTYQECKFVANTQPTESASGCLVSVCHWIGPSSFSLLKCVFDGCHEDSTSSGIVYYSTTDAGDRTINIEECQFLQCSGYYGMISVLSPTIVKMVVWNNTFSNCRSDQSSSVFLLEKSGSSYSVRDLVFDDNKCSDCTGVNDASVVKLFAQQFTFKGNSISQSTDAKWCVYISCDRKCTIEDCTFDYQNKQGNDDPNSQLLYFANQNDLEYIGCRFQNFQSLGRGPIFVARGTTPTNVDVTDCWFTSCKRTGISFAGGGAIYSGSVAVLTVQGCTFEKCESTSISDLEGGGAIYIHQQTSEGTIVNCTFIDNSNTNAMSILSITQGNAPNIELSNCTFKDHARTSTAPLLHMMYTNGVTATFSWKIDSCVFVKNHLTTQYGLVRVDTTQEILYDNCSFVDCTSTSSVGLIRLNQQAQACRLRMCEFECSTKDEVHTNCIMMLETSTSHPNEIEIASCYFKGIMILRSIVSFASSAKLLADSPYCEVMKITGCTFEDCQSSWGNLIEVIATSFELDNNSFDYGSVTQNTPMTISVTSGQSSFQNTLFAASSDVTLMELTCGENAEIQFYNCCFTRQSEVPVTQTHYLTLSVQGSVKFSTVCFYGSDQSKAISIITGQDKISYEGNPDSYFGECSCWGNVDPEPEPTSVITDPDEPSSSQESETTPSEPTKSTATETQPTTETQTRVLEVVARAMQD